MMNILVFSDSHGSVLDMFSLIEMFSPDAVLHLGDHDEDAEDLRRSYPSLTVYNVRGNNDYGSSSPNFCIVTLDGVNIYMTHGHRDGVFGTESGSVWQNALKYDCAIALYGHTHCAAHTRKYDIDIFNPGSIRLPRMGVASCLMLNIDDGKLISYQFLNTEGEAITPGEQKKKKFFRWR